MADPAHVSTILTPHYKPCLPHKEHLLSEWHVFNALFYHCQIQDFYCWILNIVFKALFFFFLIEDILHINCLISQKLYSAVPVNSLLVMSLTFWCAPYWAWLSGWDNCNPGYSSAVPALAVWGNTLQTEFWGPPPNFSCICTVGASKCWYFWEFPAGPECQRLECSASSVESACRLSDRAQAKLQLSNTYIY